MRALPYVLIAVVPGLLMPLAVTRNAPRGSVPGGSNQTPATEAPAGYDSQTNGASDQATFDADREVFEERESVEQGLGPIYNAQACGECHQTPTTGGTSQVTELRAGFQDSRGRFVDPPGGSLINDRAINPAIQERAPWNARVRTFRTSLNTLGDGFVEAIADDTLVALSKSQADATLGRIAGEVVRVPVGEAPGVLRVGRFGWKNQHASLVSFSADAYLNEMGITSPLQPKENSSMGTSVAAFDAVGDPEDKGSDVESFARFMRATKAPAPDAARAATPDAQAGSRLFDSIGCVTCHVRSIVTAPAGTVINGGAFTVPAALGNKMIHPFGDFLLHDVGTGDGIVQNGGPSTRQKMRTAPLWGLRTRARFMHDGESLSLSDAILRHRGEAISSSASYNRLDSTSLRQLFAFLNSL